MSFFGPNRARGLVESENIERKQIENVGKNLKMLGTI